MRRFSADEVAAVIRSADARLHASARLVIVGGTAVGLFADSSRATTEKLARGAEHDLQAIELLHTQQRLDADVLLERFRRHG